MKLGLASTIQIINFSTSGTILYSNENNVAMVVYCHVYMQTILHILKSSRGRLVQWEIVRLPIQRSGFNSRRNRWLFFLAVEFKYAGPRTFRITFQQNRSTPSTGHTKSGLQVSLCMKRNVPTNWSYEVTYLDRWMHDIIHILLHYSTN